jgi:hypothetical protein
MPSADPSPDKVVEDREMEEKVLETINAMPTNYRTVTMLFYINDYSQKEIAGFLEVPVTTVKSRLHASRKWLRERMITMTKRTLEKNALPKDFAHRLLMFPFPHREPPVDIVDHPGERLEITCIDAQSHFLPLTENGKCDWAFYDWPGGRLTGVYECHVVSAAKWKQGILLREWTRYTDFDNNGQQEWKEEYILVENDTYRWVNVERARQEQIRLSTFYDGSGQPSEPRPMGLKAGARWGEIDSCQVAGASQVTIGNHSWNCLKVTCAPSQGRTTGTTPLILAEWYVADSGRTVFFRRYNGPGWRKPESPGSFESLAGNVEVEFQGTRFRHWYDCIPDHALEKALQ